MNNKKGFALFVTLGFIAIIILIGFSYIFLATNELTLTLKIRDSIKAFYLAEAGLARKLMEIETGNEGGISAETVLFPDGRSGTYSVTVNNDVVTPLPEYLITSTGTYYGIHGNSVKRTEMRIRAQTPGHYGYLSESEALYFRGAKFLNEGWYGTGDILEGATHTNDHFHLYGRPIFDGPVTQTATSTTSRPDGYQPWPLPVVTNPDFRHGFDYGISKIELPKEEDFIVPLTEAAEQDPLPSRAGQYPENWHLTGATTITFLSNGTMKVINEAGYGDTNEHVEDMPASKAIFVSGGNLKISGVIIGQLTVGSAENVIITNNLTYDSPAIDADGNATNSTDVLGIVTQKDVVLGSEAPYDVDVGAYIVAPNGCFYFDSAKTAPTRGTVTHVGGSTVKFLGLRGVLSLSGKELTLKSGYNLVLHYDTRLNTKINPPYFPILKNAIGFSLFTKISWREL